MMEDHDKTADIIRINADFLISTEIRNESGKLTSKMKILMS